MTGTEKHNQSQRDGDCFFHLVTFSKGAEEQALGCEMRSSSQSVGAIWVMLM